MMSCALQSALLGFPWCNIFQCCPVDILHQDYNGMSKHICEAVNLLIDNNFPRAAALSTKAELNRRLLEMRNVFWARIPKEGLEAAALNAEVINCKVATKTSTEHFSSVIWPTVLQSQTLWDVAQERKGIMKLLLVAVDGLLPNEVVRFLAGDTTAVASQYACRLTGT